MSQPVLFVIDNDAGGVRALQDDLTRRFGEDFRVIGESAATARLAALRGPTELHERGAAHRRSPSERMPGVGFLARAHDMHPQVAAVRAMPSHTVRRCAGIRHGG